MTKRKSIKKAEPRKYGTFDEPARERFLEVLGLSGQIQAAADAVGITRATVHYHRERDSEFAERMHEAMWGRFPDLVRSEVVNRAVVGWLEPVFNKDGRVYDEARDLEGRPVLFAVEAIDPRTKKLVALPGEAGRPVYYDEYKDWGPEEFQHYDCPLVPANKRVKSDPLLLALARRVDPGFREGRDAGLPAAPRTPDRERLVEAIRELPPAQRRMLEGALRRVVGDDIIEGEATVVDEK